MGTKKGAPKKVARKTTRPKAGELSIFEAAMAQVATEKAMEAAAVRKAQIAVVAKILKKSDEKEDARLRKFAAEEKKYQALLREGVDEKRAEQMAKGWSPFWIVICGIVILVLRQLMFHGN